VLLEAVEAVLPDRSVPVDPFDGAVERVVLQPAGPVLGFPPTTDQPGPLEDLLVFRDGLQALVERLGQFVDRRLAVGQAGQDRPTRRVGERREGQAELVVRQGRSSSQVFNSSVVQLMS
jgi:hypothetical protein